MAYRTKEETMKNYFNKSDYIKEESSKETLDESINLENLHSELDRFTVKINNLKKQRATTGRVPTRRNASGVHTD